MARRTFANDEERRAARRESQRRYLERHPERRKATIKAAWERLRTDPERYARFLRQGRESYARNRESSYLYSLSWRAANRESVRARNRAQGHERRTVVRRTKAVDEFVRVLRRDPCCYCGRPAAVVDHIVPVSAGGLHEPENLTGACRSCNARKRSQSLLHFLLARQGAVHPAG